jgi:hypothetical protein
MRLLDLVRVVARHAALTLFAPELPVERVEHLLHDETELGHDDLARRRADALSDREDGAAPGVRLERAVVGVGVNARGHASRSCARGASRVMKTRGASA